MTVLRVLRNRIESTIDKFINETYADMMQAKEQGLLHKDASLSIVERMMLDTVLDGKTLDPG